MMTARTPDFQPPPVLDLRQDGPLPGLSPSLTTITVHADHRGHLWIQADDVELTERPTRGCWILDVKVRGAADAEHDVAVALRMGLTGVALRMASGGRLWIDGFVGGDDPGMFRVPEPGWDQLKGATRCTHKGCRGRSDRHVIVEDGKYIPPPNVELFERLRGLRVEIVTGAAR